jgi:hypothetical protein
MIQILGVVLVLLLGGPAALAVEHPISTPPIGPAPGGVGSNSQLVPLGEGFLAVWGGGNTLRAMRIDPNGRPRDAESFVVVHTTVPFANIFSFQVASDGSSAFVLSPTNGDDSWHYRLDRVDADGTVTNLSPNLLNVPGFTPYTSFAMAANGGKLLILTLHDAQSVGATLIDRNGTVLQSNRPLVGSGHFFNVDVESAGDGFRLTWVDDARIVRVLSLSLSDVGANMPLPSSVVDPDGLGDVPRTAGDGTHAIVVWTRVQTSPEGVELRARPLSTSGSPQGDRAVSIGKFKPLTNPQVVPAADGYQIVFLELAPSSGALAGVQVTTVAIAPDGTFQGVAHTPAGFAGPNAYFSPSGDSLLAARNGASVTAMWGERRYQPAYVAELVVAPLRPDGGVGIASLLSTSLPVQHMRKLLPVNGVIAGLWTEEAPNKRVVVGRFTQAGVPLDGAGLRLTDSISDQKYSAVATDGERLFVVWTESYNLYGALVPLTGPLIGSAPLRLTTDVALPFGYGDDALSVAWNGSTFTVVYGRFDQRDDYRLDLAALRVDRFGNVVDPAPVSLTHASGDQSSEAVNPRISWNGTSYLIVWQRRVMAVNSASGDTYPVNDLRAQRFTASLVADGEEISLDTPVDNLVGPHGSAESPDLALSNGVWLASWFSRSFYYPFRPTPFARIDANGLIDQANRVLPAFSAPLLAPVADGWIVLTGDGMLSFAKIRLDGTVSPWLSTLAKDRTAEAFAFTSLPLVAYKKGTDPYLAYIDEIAAADHRRTVAR